MNDFPEFTLFSRVIHSPGCELLISTVSYVLVSVSGRFFESGFSSAEDLYQAELSAFVFVGTTVCLLSKKIALC